MDIYRRAENGLSSLSPSGVSVCILFHRHSSLAILKAPPSEEMSHSQKWVVDTVLFHTEYQTTWAQMMSYLQRR